MQIAKAEKMLFYSILYSTFDGRSFKFLNKISYTNVGEKQLND